MDEGEGRRDPAARPGRPAAWVAWAGRVGAVLVVLLLVAAFAAQALDLGHRWGIAPPDPREDPAAVAPPTGLALPAPAPRPGLDLPDPATAATVAAPLDGERIDPAAVRRALGALPDARRLG